MSMASIVTEAAATSSEPAFILRDSHGANTRFQRLAAILPSLTDMIFVLCLAAVARAGAYFVSADGDAARHLTVGENMLSTGRLLREDVFSFTMFGQPFVAYEWLAEVASAASYRVLGLAGPVLLHGAIIALTFSFVLARLRRRGGSSLLPVGVTMLVAATAQIHWLARPHVFSFLGTAVFCLILDDWRAGRLSHKWLWALPGAMVLWANLHGGFLVGLLLIATYLGADILRWLGGTREIATGAARSVRRLLPVALITLAATCVNPVGPALLGHVFGWFGNTLLINLTQEYTSPNFHQAPVRGFAAMILVAVACVAWSRRRPALHEGLLLLGFLYLALFSSRNVPLFAIVVAPILARQLAAMALPGGRLGKRVERVAAWLGHRDHVLAHIDARSRFHLWPVAVLLGLAALAFVQRDAGAPLGVRFDPARQPVAAVAYLKAHPQPGHMFNNFIWGGYVLHELWPAQRVFIDGQTDFYGEALTQEYLDVQDVKPGWRDVLDRYDVQWILFPSDSALEQVLIASGNWDTVYRDSMAVILTRHSSA
jgi:hypothetical protein